MKKILFLFLVMWVSPSFAENSTEAGADSLLLGTWMLKDPTQAKILTSSGEPFLRCLITFADRRKYSVEKENHSWEWTYDPVSRKLTIIDMEMEESMEYVVKSASSQEIIIMVGKQEFVYRRINH